MSVLVSVVTITYNIIDAGRKEFLRQCFESVHNQTYDNIEHIVIDGASTDGTVELIREYADKGWITYISEPDKGIYEAMNKGIDRASGKYIAFLNSDDFWHDPRGVEESVKYLEQENADFSYATCYYLDKNENYLACLKPQIGSFYIRMPFSHQTMFTKREKMLELGKFDENYRSAADYDFVYRLILSGAKGVQVPLNFTTYRFIGISSVQTDISISECKKIFEKIFAQYGFSAEDSLKCMNDRPKKEYVEKILNNVDFNICEEVKRTLKLCVLDEDGYYFENFIPFKHKMRVLYDVSALADIKRKGDEGKKIFSIVKGIALELLKRKELEVAAYCDKHCISEVKNILAEDKDFSKLTWYTGKIKEYDIFFFPRSLFLKKIDICCYTYCYDLFSGQNYEAVKQSLSGFGKYDDYVFTVSEAMKRDLLHNMMNKVDSKKIMPVPLVPADYFYKDDDREKNQSIREKYAIPVNKKYIISACSVHSDDTLISTIKNFIACIKKNHIEDLVFTLVGELSDTVLKQLNAEVEDFEIYREKIITTGTVEESELASLYSHAECFVYMALNGFGLPVLEAMKCGCPVIALNVSAVVEMTGEAGITLDPQDQNAMIKAYETIYFDMSYKKQLSEKSIERTALLSWENTVDCMVRSFMNVNTNRKKMHYKKFIIKLLGCIPLFAIKNDGLKNNVSLFNIKVKSYN